MLLCLNCICFIVADCAYTPSQNLKELLKMRYFQHVWKPGKCILNYVLFWLSAGFCAVYNTDEMKVIDDFKTDCTKFSEDKCPTRYLSSDTYLCKSLCW